MNKPKQKVTRVRPKQEPYEKIAHDVREIMRKNYHSAGGVVKGEWGIFFTHQNMEDNERLMLAYIISFTTPKQKK